MAGGGKNHHNNKCNDAVKKLVKMAWIAVDREHKNCCNRPATKVSGLKVKEYLNNLIVNSKHTISLGCDSLKDDSYYKVCRTVLRDMEKESTKRVHQLQNEREREMVAAATTHLAALLD